MKTIFLFPAGVGIIEAIILLIFVFGIMIGVFLAIRSLLLWYWKVDKFEYS